MSAKKQKKITYENGKIIFFFFFVKVSFLPSTFVAVAMLRHKKE